MVIKITNFAKRHFDPKFGGTKILDYTAEQFEDTITVTFSKIIEAGIEKLKKVNKKEEGGIFTKSTTVAGGRVNIINGYADFCKLIAIENFTDARVGTMPITLENYQYIRSGYSARAEKELPVFSRWLELPLGKPKAKWLMLVLYSKEQLDKEADLNDGGLDEVNEFNADWGIVSIHGQLHFEEEPMKPETMIRNALGIQEGGSGVPLDKYKYLESVGFWSKNCTVK